VIRITPHLDAWYQLLNRVEAAPALLEGMIGETADAWGVAATTAMKANHDANAHAIQRYENQTFDLTESIGFDLQPLQHNGGSTTQPIRIFAAAPYAYDVEHGVPGRSAAYPYFWREVMSGQWAELVVVRVTAGVNELLASTAERA